MQLRMTLFLATVLGTLGACQAQDFTLANLPHTQVTQEVLNNTLASPHNLRFALENLPLTDEFAKQILRFAKYKQLRDALGDREKVADPKGLTSALSPTYITTPFRKHGDNSVNAFAAQFITLPLVRERATEFKLAQTDNDPESSISIPGRKERNIFRSLTEHLETNFVTFATVSGDNAPSVIGLGLELLIKPGANSNFALSFMVGATGIDVNNNKVNGSPEVALGIGMRVKIQ